MNRMERIKALSESPRLVIIITGKETAQSPVVRKGRERRYKVQAECNFDLSSTTKNKGHCCLCVIIDTQLIDRLGIGGREKQWRSAVWWSAAAAVAVVKKGNRARFSPAAVAAAEIDEMGLVRCPLLIASNHRRRNHLRPKKNRSLKCSVCTANRRNNKMYKSWRKNERRRQALCFLSQCLRRHSIIIYISCQSQKRAWEEEVVVVGKSLNRSRSWPGGRRRRSGNSALTANRGEVQLALFSDHNWNKLNNTKVELRVEHHHNSVSASVKYPRVQANQPTNQQTNSLPGLTDWLTGRQIGTDTAELSWRFALIWHTNTSHTQIREITNTALLKQTRYLISFTLQRVWQSTVVQKEAKAKWK